jgi:ferric-dicitrate binding protein FerR (iron transport regulator)
MRSASCPAIERLAAVASGEPDAHDDHEDLLAHLDECLDCQEMLDEQSTMRNLAGQMAAPRLSTAQREAIGAEVMAHADHMPMRRRRMVPLVGAGLAVAAGIAIALGVGAFGRSSDEAVEVATIHAPDPVREPMPSPAPTVVENVVTDDKDVVAPRPTVVAERPTRAKLDGTADYSRKLTDDREIVKLASGELTVDTNHSAARPVQVVTGDTTLAFKRARVKVIATKGAIAQVSVFAGTAEITVNGTTQVIEAGMVWERPASPADSSSAFQEGWTALREGRNAEAIAAFDRAVDPMVAEDALYWGAIASERVGDLAGAKQRYEMLVEKFPKSPRAKKAKKALFRLDDQPATE